jgi:hypothetical protein
VAAERSWHTTPFEAAETVPKGIVVDVEAWVVVVPSQLVAEPTLATLKLKVWSTLKDRSDPVVMMNPIVVLSTGLETQSVLPKVLIWSQ